MHEAFIETFRIEPTARGALDGLSFAAKDLIDVAGRKTGCGNPQWRDSHPAPRSHAVCIEQLLASGAHCVGKTVTDELAFSLLGENHFYGTPLNPRAPDRVPGGSSSGSASAVASGVCDFALGTDTGGSVRVPAANCGIWGWRPTHGRVSTAGVNPLAPGFDTVGALAKDSQILERVARVLAGLPEIATFQGRIHVLREAFEISDETVRDALAQPLTDLRKRFDVVDTSVNAVLGTQDFHDLHETFRVLQWAEIDSALGAWVESAKPQLGPMTAEGFALVRSLDRSRVAAAARRREEFIARLRAFLHENDFICIPTAAALAPIKGSGLRRGDPRGYYPRTLSLTAIAGIGRLPQVSMPLGTHDGVPVGLSLIAAQDRDAQLLAFAREISC